MRTREVSIVTALVAIIMYRLVTNPMSATLLYMLGTRLLRLDVGHSVVVNFDGEVEDGVLTHRFVPITETSEGDKVHVTYHLVECGAADAEPLVFYHGLAETWRLWKAEMLPFCDTHRVIAVDSEGMGQSYWPWPQVDIPKGRSRTFMAHMNLALLDKLGVDRFNMVVTDYSFWSTLAIVSEHGGKGGRLLRYGKFQSTVGVEDPGRVPQAKLLINAPKFMHFLLAGAPTALPRVLYGHPHPSLPLPGLKVQSRTGVAGVPEEVFNSEVLSGIGEDPFHSWILFYNRGVDMLTQMHTQLAAFENLHAPVSMVQGDQDLGQPRSLFDGTARYSTVYRPISGIRDRLSRFNATHEVNTEYSTDGSIIGPTASEFFPNSPWVRFKFLEGVGHFPHVEAPEACIEVLRELLAVPVE